MVSLVLAMAAGNSAWAACDVTPPYSIIAAGQTVTLSADCGVALTSINWQQNGTTVTGDVTLNQSGAAAVTFTTPASLTGGSPPTSYTFTATAVPVSGPPSIAAGTEAKVLVGSGPMLTVTPSAGGTSTVASAPAGISACANGSGDCSEAYPFGTSVSLAATPDTGSGYSFGGWGGDCTGTGACNVSMTAARNVTATFTAGTPPTAPTTVTAAAGSGQITVSFSGQTLGSGTLTNYQATCSVAGAGAGTPVSGSGSPIVVTPLDNGTAYLCNVRTITNVGTSAWSANSNSATPVAGTPPSAPTIGTATAGNAQISVAFTPGSIGTGTLVNYEATCSVAGGGAGTPVSGAGSPIVVTGLTNGTAYLCNARTTSTVGTSPWSANSNPATPAASNCGPGEVMDTGDRTWSPLTTTTLFPIPPVSGSGDLGRAIKFTADGATYPKGIKLQTIDESANGLPKDVVISACPHSFVPVGGQANCFKSGTTGFYMYLRYSTSPSAPASYDCQLQAGTDYYINFRHYVTSGTRGTVSAQFGAMTR